MSDEATRQSNNVVAPTQSSTPGEGVTWLATSTSAAAHDLSGYPELFHKYVDLTASGGKIWVSGGPAATPVIDKAGTPGATIAAGTLTTNPVPIASGETKSWRLDPSLHKYLHVQADSGTPTLIITPSSQPALRSR